MRMKIFKYIECKITNMPCTDSKLEDLPDWTVAASKDAVEPVISFWNNHSETAYTYEELADAIDVDMDSLIDIITTMQYDDVITKKGVYFRPTNIESAYETWQDARETLD